MRRTALFCLILLAACSNEANHLGNPLSIPLRAVTNGFDNAAYMRTRGQVELFVKTNHPAIIADLEAGGGPNLTRAFDIAEAPEAVRSAHTLQMQSDLEIYRQNLGATVVAIMVVSDA
ncbi:MAG: hypothetical protein AAGL89_02095 [Pseudomonadota bacterium]